MVSGAEVIVQVPGLLGPARRRFRATRFEIVPVRGLTGERLHIYDDSENEGPRCVATFPPGTWRAVWIAEAEVRDET